MEILKFNIFNFLNKSKKTAVSLISLCPTFPYAYSSARTPLFICHCTEYKLTGLQTGISEENKPNAATKELMTAKFWLRVEKSE